MERYFEANAVLSLFSKQYMELKKGLPIRPSEMGVLNIITQTPGPHSSVMLAELLGVSKPMITAHLTSLQSKGYIVREQSPEDKRVYHILPTDSGRELVEYARRDMERCLSRMTEVMGREGFDTFVDLARKASQVMTESRGDKV